MTTQEQLQQVFNDNFVSYFHTHVAHVNIVGRNFVSDHELLGEIYEQLQGQIDSLAELIRTIGDFMPITLGEVMLNSHNTDEPMAGTSDQLLSAVKDHLEHLFDCYVDLNEVADEEELEHIANYAQEQMLILKKFVWKLESVLE
jgi:starvation-inducible DNA-binding protein